MTASTANGPFVGLAPFSGDDADYFFGRETESRILVSNLFASPFTLIHGPSGVGKSSLLNAGVLPRLDRDPMVEAIPFRLWTGDPVLQLIRAVRKGAPDAPWPKIGTQDLHTTLGLVADHKQDSYLMLILDQFEEYFMYHPAGSAFERQLSQALADETLPLSVLVSMREDSVAKVDRFDGHVANLLDNVIRIEHLTIDGGREAIVRPLEVYSARTGTEASAEEELIALVLEQVRAGEILFSPGGGGIVPGAVSEPRIEAAYLQLGMARLWQVESEETSTILRASTLRELGGVKAAVQSNFSELMANLSSREQDLAAELFYYLVTPSKTKIAWRAEDLAYYAHCPKQDVADLLTKLAQSEFRILRRVETLSESESETRYEAYHDILARAILDWRDRYESRKQQRLSERQSANIDRWRRRLAELEAKAEQASPEDAESLVYSLRALGKEAEAFDPGIAMHARDLVAALGSRTRSRSTRSSIDGLEMRQLLLLRDEAQLAQRAGVSESATVVSLMSRLIPLLNSDSAEVRAAAHDLLAHMLPVESGQPGDEIAAFDPTSYAPLSEAPDYASARRRALDDVRTVRPIYRRGGFWLFMAVVPSANLAVPVAVEALLDTVSWGAFGSWRDGRFWSLAILTALAWSVVHLYCAIDNALPDKHFVLPPVLPYSVSWFTSIVAWPFNQAVPWLVAAAAAAIARAWTDGGGGSTYGITITGASYLAMAFYSACMVLVWRPGYIVRALGLGRAVKA